MSSRVQRIVITLQKLINSKFSAGEGVEGRYLRDRKKEKERERERDRGRQIQHDKNERLTRSIRFGFRTRKSKNNFSLVSFAVINHPWRQFFKNSTVQAYSILFNNLFLTPELPR